MSLGVLNNIAAIYAQNNLNQTQGSLQNTLTQLSSGSRINSGADDAAGLAVANGLGANVAALTQSAQNASDGIGLLQTADGALSQVTNLLNRAVTLSTEAANGTLNGNQVSAANQEYQNILSEVGNIGSKTNFNGNAVFTSQAKTVFVSDGTVSGANNFSETIGTLSAGSVGIAAPGSTTSLTLANPATAVSSVAVVGQNASNGSAATATLAYNSSSDKAGGTVSLTYGGTSINSDITGGSSLSSAVEQLNASITAAGVTGLTAAQGTGANANKIILTGTADAAGTTSGTNSLSFTSGGTDTSTTAVANPSNSTSSTTVAAAGTFTFGSSSDTAGGDVHLTYGSTAITGTISAGSSLSSAVTQLNSFISLSGATGLTAVQGTGANANKIILTGSEDTSTPGTNSLSFSSSNAITDTASATVSNPATSHSTPNVTYVPASTGVATSTLTFGTASNTAGGAVSLSYGGKTITGNITAGSTLTSAVSQLNSFITAAGATGLTAALGTGANANKIILTGSADTGTGSDTAGTNSISFNAGNAISDTTVASTTAGAGVNFAAPSSGAGTATDISQLNAGSAANVLTSVTAAIGDVAYQRGIVGADINELTAASNVASAESENLTSAQSNIESTNYGQATSNLAKFQVLSQTGISALAQANSVQQEVLKLLQ